MKSKDEMSMKSKDEMTMKSKDDTKVTRIDSHKLMAPQPLLIWQEARQLSSKATDKVVNLSDYVQSQEALAEASIVSWNLPGMDDVKPVKLIMISSGFKPRGLGINTIQSMAA